jgi:hypothetical protein
MRWRTYQRYVDKYDHYEAVLDEGTLAALARLLRRTKRTAYGPGAGSIQGVLEGLKPKRYEKPPCFQRCGRRAGCPFSLFDCLINFDVCRSGAADYWAWRRAG